MKEYQQRRTDQGMCLAAQFGQKACMHASTIKGKKVPQKHWQPRLQYAKTQLQEHRVYFLHQE